MYEIDPNAPVRHRAGIYVAAPPARVWALLSDIGGWPKWNRDVRSAELQGPLQPGTAFVWQAGPGTIRSTLQSVVPEREIAWTGSTMGIRAVHVWRIEPRDGGTHLITEESWSGLLARVLRGPSQRTLERSIATGFQYIKTALE